MVINKEFPVASGEGFRAIAYRTEVFSGSLLKAKL